MEETAICVLDKLEFDDDAKLRVTDDGYLAAVPRVARTGIQLYNGDEVGRHDMAQVRVWRPEAEVFSMATRKSFAHRPITNDHPPENVTAANWKQYAIGQADGDVARDGDFIRVPMVLMDQTAVEDVRSGKRELSAGYSARLVWQSGVTPQGEKYDAIQKGIRVNHIALCTAARGGPKLCLGDSFVFGENHQQRRDDMATRTITVDGISIEVPDTAASIIMKTVDALMETVRTLTAKADAAVKDAETKGGEIAVLNKKLKDAELTPAQRDAMVAERLDVVTRARAALGDTFDAGGKTDAEIRRTVVAAKLTDAVTKPMSDDAVTGAFMALTVMRDATGSHAIARNFMFDTAGVNNSQQAADTAYNDRNKNLSDAWKNTPKQ